MKREQVLKHINKNNVVAAIGASVCCIAIAFGVNVFVAQQRLDALELEQVRQDAETTRIQNQVAEHTHTWVPSTKTVHHNAVTKEVYHEPIYDLQTTYHTVCNECEAVIDGNALAHIADTAHAGYSTNVPISSEVLRQAAYFQTVVVEDAWDETVTEGVVCTSCGEKLTTSEASEAGVNVSQNVDDAQDSSVSRAVNATKATDATNAAQSVSVSQK